MWSGQVVLALWCAATAGGASAADASCGSFACGNGYRRIAHAAGTPCPAMSAGECIVDDPINLVACCTVDVAARRGQHELYALDSEWFGYTQDIPNSGNVNADFVRVYGQRVFVVRGNRIESWRNDFATKAWTNVGEGELDRLPSPSTAFEIIRNSAGKLLSYSMDDRYITVHDVTGADPLFIASAEYRATPNPEPCKFSASSPSNTKFVTFVVPGDTKERLLMLFADEADNLQNTLRDRSVQKYWPAVDAECGRMLTGAPQSLKIQLVTSLPTQGTIQALRYDAGSSEWSVIAAGTATNYQGLDWLGQQMLAKRVGNGFDVLAINDNLIQKFQNALPAADGTSPPDSVTAFSIGYTEETVDLAGTIMRLPNAAVVDAGGVLRMYALDQIDGQWMWRFKVACDTRDCAVNAASVVSLQRSGDHVVMHADTTNAAVWQKSLCDEEPYNAFRERDYTSCSMAVLDPTMRTPCTIECAAGGVKADTNFDSEVLPDCSARGVWVDPFTQADFQCLPNVCQQPIADTTHPNADYTACIGKKSFELCEPTCTQPDPTKPALINRGTIELVCGEVMDGVFDASDATCVTEACLEPDNDGGHLDWTECNGAFRGTACDIVCEEGYVASTAGPAAPVTVPVECDAEGTYKTSTMNLPDCQPQACMGPDPSKMYDMSIDFSPCTSTTTGAVCTPVCPAGKTLNAPMTLVCEAGTGLFDASLFECLGDNPACLTAVPVDTRIDFSDCTEGMKRSGDTCIPKCADGYTAPPVAAFTMTCNMDGTFMYTSADVPQCTPRNCDQPLAATRDVFADYMSCMTQTGAMCTPVCNAGYAPTDNSTSFNLVCDASGSFDASAFECRPNRCLRSDSMSMLNIDDCTDGTALTGDMCLPRCDAAGYGPSRESFVLVCAPDGVFTLPADVQCVPHTCLAPVNADPQAMLGPCSNGRATGQLCEPTGCRLGYFPKDPDLAFPLVCDEAGNFDASEYECEAIKCEVLGTANADPNANYDACLQGPLGATSSGALCTPTCNSEYELIPGVDPTFDVVCTRPDGELVLPADKHELCRPFACFAGPAPGTADPNAIFDDCLALLSGDPCTPRCNAGYLTMGVLTLACTSAHTFEATSVQCAPALCLGMPLNPDPNADYSSCTAMGKATGDDCTPECAAGYSPTQPSFTLVCDATTGSFDARAVTCAPHRCDGGPEAGSASPLTDYSPCNTQVSGTLCVPRCDVGFSISATMPSFILSCDEKGEYDGSAVACQKNTCLAPKPGTADANADYSPCNANKQTQDVCMPTCADGFVPSAMTGFELTCDEMGFYDASEWRCDSAPCTGGVRMASADPNANYDACMSKTSGEVCEPTCGMGYAAPPNMASFSLVCEGNTFDDGRGAVCVKSDCSGGPTDPTRDPNADYMVCNAQLSGTLCVPGCDDGYTLSDPLGFVLMCDGEGVYPAGAVRCEAGACGRGPLAGTADAAADYTACTAATTGAICEPTCEAGYTRMGDAFPLVCTDLGYSAAGVTCAANPCNGGPAPGTADGNTLLAACDVLTTGGQCVATCKPGFTLKGDPFTLVCDKNNQYDASAVVCEAAVCNTAKQGTADPNADLKACMGLASGVMCPATCADGYAANVDSFPLDCVLGVFDASALQCTPHPCDGGPAANVDPLADYSRCMGGNTGDICTPLCPAGYSLEGAPFPMVCDAASKRFNAAGATCKPSPCILSPSGVPHATFAACTSGARGVTGAACTPVCEIGYELTGDFPFTLQCDAMTGGFEAPSDLKCEPRSCGPLDAVVENAVQDEAACRTAVTGAQCNITCAAGYVFAPASAGGLVCTGLTLANVEVGTCAPADCPQFADGAPVCKCSSGYTGALTWNAVALRWDGMCKERTITEAVEEAREVASGVGTTVSSVVAVAAVVGGATASGVPGQQLIVEGIDCEGGDDDDEDLELIINPTMLRINGSAQAGAIIANTAICVALCGVFRLMVFALIQFDYEMRCEDEAALYVTKWKRAAAIIRYPSVCLPPPMFLIPGTLECVFDLIFYPRDDMLVNVIGYLGLIIIGGFMFWLSRTKDPDGTATPVTDIGPCKRYFFGNYEWMSNRDLYVERHGVSFDIYRPLPWVRGQYWALELLFNVPLAMIVSIRSAKFSVCIVKVVLLAMIFGGTVIMFILQEVFLASFLKHVMIFCHACMCIGLLFHIIAFANEDTKHWSVEVGVIFFLLALFGSLIRAVYDLVTFIMDMVSGYRTMERKQFAVEHGHMPCSIDAITGDDEMNALDDKLLQQERAALAYSAPAVDTVSRDALDTSSSADELKVEPQYRPNGTISGYQIPGLSFNDGAVGAAGPHMMSGSRKISGPGKAKARVFSTDDAAGAAPNGGGEPPDALGIVVTPAGLPGRSPSRGCSRSPMSPGTAGAVGLSPRLNRPRALTAARNAARTDASGLSSAELVPQQPGLAHAGTSPALPPRRQRGLSQGPAIQLQM